MNNAVLTLLLSLYVYSEGDIKSAFKVSTTRVRSDRRVDTRVVGTSASVKFRFIEDGTQGFGVRGTRVYGASSVRWACRDD
jgi:hypothetical protein